ncbi:Uu.00g132500.m01.CDS01 [Anthostomella pinea]|uniref:Uu.00g132500.m01.CDS01 n=1 Tax=Anthostomella pinea TaxID=933095 RepID=A0AAI8VJP6_9PEZI|nr:Uu.00g132500.m01.CDS01 [Anthostomella pinea]
MAVEVVTIVNSSGKIISNGKHLINILKEAKASYQEKKAAIKAERAVKRSQTYDISTVPRYVDDVVEYGSCAWERRASQDELVSRFSSGTSHRSKSHRSSRHRSASRTRGTLTERNLKTLSEVSSTAPSRAPVAYRSPYAETAPRDMALSRPTLGYAPTMPMAFDDTPMSTPRYSTHVHRSSSDPSLQEKGKEIDMDLAYGNIPPDLKERVDLDPAYKAAQKERRAHDLMGKIEGLLTEAHCLHHTATHIIQHLQSNPEAAAAVALTLAELSALLGKMSPSFLGIIKGGSPAVFALLASPQFLIAAGLTVGVTVVMFGGWKIIKRIQEAKGAEAAAILPMAFQAYPGQPSQPPYPESGFSAGFDEALVVEEELSTIESWRRGIAPFGEDGSADLELISPEADRAMRSQYGADDARTERSVRTSRTHKTAKSSKTTKSHKSQKSRRADAIDDDDIPERKSSKGLEQVDNASESGSHRSHRSHRSEKTERTSKSKRTDKTERKAIEDGRKDKDNSLEMVIRPKKDTMLKSLFKKKKDQDERGRSAPLLRVS